VALWLLIPESLYAKPASVLVVVPGTKRVLKKKPAKIPVGSALIGSRKTIKRLDGVSIRPSNHSAELSGGVTAKRVKEGILLNSSPDVSGHEYLLTIEFTTRTYEYQQIPARRGKRLLNAGKWVYRSTDHREENVPVWVGYPKSFRRCSYPWVDRQRCNCRRVFAR
jgi:hypothetical protein